MGRHGVTFLNAAQASAMATKGQITIEAKDCQSGIAAAASEPNTAKHRNQRGRTQRLSPVALSTQ